jgi:hypothetical protein
VTGGAILENFMERFNQLTVGEKAITIGGLALLIVGLLFPWWSWSEGGFSVSQSGMEDPGAFWGILAVLLGLVMAGLVLAQRFGNVQLPDLGSITWAQAWGGAGAALVIFMLLKAWRIMSADIGGFGWGFFLALIAAAAVVYGAFMKYQEDQTAAR